MKSITEHKVDWSILSNTLELELPIKAQDYPIDIRIFDAAEKLVLEATFKQPPVIFRSTFTTGEYCYKVVKNGKCIYTDFITIKWS